MLIKPHDAHSGATPHIEDRWGKTALDYAKELADERQDEESRDILKLLEAVEAEAAPAEDTVSCDGTPDFESIAKVLQAGVEAGKVASLMSCFSPQGFSPLDQYPTPEKEVATDTITINVQIEPTKGKNTKRQTPEAITLVREVHAEGTLVEILEALHQAGHLESKEAETDPRDFTVHLEETDRLVEYDMGWSSEGSEWSCTNLARDGVVEHSTVIIEWSHEKYNKRIDKEEVDELVTEILYYAAGSRLLELKRIAAGGQSIVVEDYDNRTSLQWVAL